MKYYKIQRDNTIIGVINSNNFIRYQANNNLFIGANESTGDFAEYDNNIYRSLWMKPLTREFDFSYEIVDILEINKEEYNILVEAFKKQEAITIDEDIEPLPQPNDWIIPDTSSIDFIRSSKLKEMSYACRTTIEAGFDLDIHDEKQHFSLTTQDQLNLMSLGAMAQTQSLIPYHADGEQTTFYTSEEINEIVEAANSFKIYHTTYYNALKDYINSLETIEEISAITYGVEIPEEYKSNVLKILEE